MIDANNCSIRCQLSTRSLTIAEKLRDALYQLKSCQLLHICVKKMHVKTNSWIIYIKNVIANGVIRYAMPKCHLLLVVCSSNVCIVHHFRDINFLCNFVQCTWLPVTLRSPSVLTVEIRTYTYRQRALSDSCLNMCMLYFQTAGNPTS